MRAVKKLIISTAIAASLMTTSPIASAAPGDFIWFFQTTSVQLASTLTRSTTYWTDTTIARYEANLVRQPNSIFATFYRQRIAQLQTRQAAFGDLSLSACREGSGISAGPYGTFTRGAC